MAAMEKITNPKETAAEEEPKVRAATRHPPPTRRAHLAPIWTTH